MNLNKLRDAAIRQALEVADGHKHKGKLTPGELLDLVGWITMQNKSGKTFHDAKVKLMAGDVSKVNERDDMRPAARGMMAMEAKAGGPPVTEKAFDEFHLYTLERPATPDDADFLYRVYASTRQEELAVVPGLLTEVRRPTPS
jgi:hypothetical protein